MPSFFDKKHVTKIQSEHNFLFTSKFLGSSYGIIHGLWESENQITQQTVKKNSFRKFRLLLFSILFF